MTRPFALNRALLTAVCVTLSTGCSLLVQPDLQRLDGAAADAASDITMSIDRDPPTEGGVVEEAGADVVSTETSTDASVEAGPDAMTACPLGCNDGVGCTEDSCNEMTGTCVFTANSAMCRAGEVCNPAMGGCVMQGCRNDNECDDRNACNGAETCASGMCRGGTPLSCDDGDACNGAETCDPAAGCRAGSPLRCDDGLFCNGTETCERARGCVPGTAPTCDDRVACTTDRCNETTRACEAAPNPALCPAGQVCNPAMGGCVMQGCRNDGECDDRNVCNGVERCNMGTCLAGTAMVCDDRNACNGVESCDPTRGCRPGTALMCDDGQFCNGVETCRAEIGCVGAAAPTCNDSSACTNDLCVSTANMGRGACANTPIDADGDGFPAARVMGMACAVGTDCDDSNRAINPSAREVCNGLDDNCNGAIDEGLTCTGPANDLCVAAQAITLTAAMMTTTVMGTTTASGSGVNSGCGGTGGDVWYQITYPTGMDLTVEAVGVGSMDPVLVYRTSCTSADLACNDDRRANERGSRIWIRNNPAPGGGATRTAIIVVDSYSAATEGAFSLTARVSAAANYGTCGQGRFNVSAGGTVFSYAPFGLGMFSGSCGIAGYTVAPEEVYYFTSSGGMFTAVAQGSGLRPMITGREGMVSSCPGTERGCVLAGGSGASATLTSSLNNGWLLVDGLVGSGAGSATTYTLRYTPR
ncbi:MAG: putative metal-binding motif-containing protein [Deltaproteobacteria bacterium]|nr:putative metal-binding motif-containing protein [Deltaproteobacteria bacterium]